MAELDRVGPYLRPPHVSANPARVYSHTEDPIRLQVYSHATTHHVQGALRRQAETMLLCYKIQPTTEQFNPAPQQVISGGMVKSAAVVSSYDL